MPPRRDRGPATRDGRGVEAQHDPCGSAGHAARGSRARRGSRPRSPVVAMSATAAVDHDVDVVDSPARPTSSGSVNAASAGPRRPRTTTSRIRLAASAARAPSAMSVAGQLVRVGGRGCAPRRARRCRCRRPRARSWSRGTSRSLALGVAVVPGDELGRRDECRAGPRPGTPSARSVAAPTRVDDRVVVLGQLVVAQVACRPRRRAGSGSRAASSIAANSLVTCLVCWWSGATPARTSPYGVGSRSKTSTSRSGCLSSSSAV